MENQTPEQPAADSAPESTLSYEDRVANLFGGAAMARPDPDEAPEVPADSDEQPEAQAAEDSKAQEEYFEYEYEGTRYQLPKQLEKAVMQERDYTQKAQTLAEQRRAVELRDQELRLAAIDREFTQTVSKELQELQMYEAVLQQPIQWQNMTTEEAFRKKLEVDQLKEQKEALSKSLELKRAEFQQRTMSEVQKYRDQALAEVKRRIPSWSDDTAKAVREFALSVGLNEAEVGSIMNPVHIQILHDAYQFRQAQSRASAAVKTVKAPAVKPTPSNPMDSKTKEYLNFRKTISKASPKSETYKRALSDRIASKFGG